MKGDQVEKKRIYADGEEIEGLISMDEYTLEDGVVSVPGFKKIVPVRNGVTTIPPINAVFKITRGSSTLKFMQDWYFKNEIKEITVERTDRAGTVFSTDLMSKTELSKNGVPAYDAAAPGVAQISVTLLPEDIQAIQ